MVSELRLPFKEERNPRNLWNQYHIFALVAVSSSLILNLSRRAEGKSLPCLPPPYTPQKDTKQGLFYYVFLSRMSQKINIKTENGRRK